MELIQNIVLWTLKGDKVASDYHEFYMCMNYNDISVYFIHYPKLHFNINNQRVYNVPIHEHLSTIGLKFDVSIKLGSFREDIRELPNIETHKCKLCNQELIGRTNKVYCNNDCAKKYKLLNKYGSLDKKCMECGSIFQLGNRYINYCSSKCRIKKNKRNYRDKNYIPIAREYSIKAMIEDANKIKSCSIDCLIAELGDLE